MDFFKKVIIALIFFPNTSYRKFIIKIWPQKGACPAVSGMPYLGGGEPHVVHQFGVLVELVEKLLLLLGDQRALEGADHETSDLSSGRVTHAETGIPRHAVIRLRGLQPRHLKQREGHGQ